MKAMINGVAIEGTVDEVIAYQKAMGEKQDVRVNRHSQPMIIHFGINPHAMMREVIGEMVATGAKL